MGNSNSSKLRQRSESMQIKYKSEDSFSKNKSMVELGTKTQKKVSPSVRDKERPKLQTRDSTKSSNSNGVSRQKSIRRDISHPISAQGREIITQCFDNPHSEFGNKVLQRVFEKRGDYQKYVHALGKDNSYRMTVRLKDLLEEVVAKIHDPDMILALNRAYGEEHVEWKHFGFKPDFWVTVADAITMEGVILDMANHQATDTVAAWSSLVTMMFSAVRDGYYTALRKHRMSSRRLKRQTTIDSGNETDLMPSPSIDLSSPGLSLPSTVSLRSASIHSMSSESNGTLPRTPGSVNIMAPLPSPTTNGSIYNGSQALVTYRQRPIFE